MAVAPSAWAPTLARREIGVIQANTQAVPDVVATAAHTAVVAVHSRSQGCHVRGVWLGKVIWCAIPSDHWDLHYEKRCRHRSARTGRHRSVSGLFGVADQTHDISRWPNGMMLAERPVWPRQRSVPVETQAAISRQPRAGGACHGSRC